MPNTLKTVLILGSALFATTLFCIGLGSAARAVGVDYTPRRRPVLQLLRQPNPDPDEERCRHPRVSSTTATTTAAADEHFSPDAFREDLLR